jgi:hypothetical protein
MRRIFGLMMVGGLCLGFAPTAGAQMGLGISSPFGGGIYVNPYPSGFGYNPVYGGMGYYPTGVGLGIANPLATTYRSGYLGYAPAVTGVYSSAYSGFAPGLGVNPYLPYRTTVAYPAYGANYYGYRPYGIYGYRRGFIGGMPYRAFWW